MKRFFLIIFFAFIMNANTQSVKCSEPILESDIFKLITEYVCLQDVHKDLEQLRRHAQTASKLLWLEKNEKNVELCREIVRRYLKALEKLPEYDDQKQNFNKFVQEFITSKKQQQDQTRTVYTAA